MVALLEADESEIKSKAMYRAAPVASWQETVLLTAVLEHKSRAISKSIARLHASTSIRGGHPPQNYQLGRPHNDL